MLGSLNVGFFIPECILKKCGVPNLSVYYLQQKDQVVEPDYLPKRILCYVVVETSFDKVGDSKRNLFSSPSGVADPFL